MDKQYLKGAIAACDRLISQIDYHPVFDYDILLKIIKKTKALYADMLKELYDEDHKEVSKDKIPKKKHPKIIDIDISESEERKLPKA